ncbi:nucleotide exchange factor GrpE [Auritidibacter ignavus]|uniref:nucleotide exchange factor GrpE n=1 Tax=Auritidibacter ignavus TaxID=678932 RepID=UPI00109C5606|nr:nucleotide exchange factor GrpE [Auritidibacter ignavus]
MTDQHNSQDPDKGRDEEIRFTDKRKIDPETGEVRDPVTQAEDILSQATDQQGTDAGQGVDNEHTDPTDSSGEASAEVAELRDDLQRLQAEFINYRRRVERDRDVAKDNATVAMLEALLPVLDDLDAAREHGDLADGPFAAIAQKLDSVLSQFGLQRQDQQALAGEEFNPAHHEAMLRQPSDEVPAEHIVQVFRNGYVRHDRVIRAAQVMVSAGPADAQ